MEVETQHVVVGSLGAMRWNLYPTWAHREYFQWVLHQFHALDV